MGKLDKDSQKNTHPQGESKALNNWGKPVMLFQEENKTRAESDGHKEIKIRIIYYHCIFTDNC